MVATVLLEAQMISKYSWHTGLCLVKKLRENQAKIFVKCFGVFKNFKDDFFSNKKFTETKPSTNQHQTRVSSMFQFKQRL
jgi:hypothetical protein